MTSAEENWEKKWLDLEKEQAVESSVGPRNKKLPTGIRPDIALTSLGAVLGASFMGTVWFLGFWYDLFESSAPWFALALAGGIVYGVKFGSTRRSASDMVIAGITYVVALLAVLGAITYHSSTSLKSNEFSLSSLENLMYKRHFDSFDEAKTYILGLLIVLVLTSTIRRK